MTLVELMLSGLIATVLLTAMGAFIISSLRAGAFAEGHSASLNEARNAMQQIEKEIRGADAIQWAPLGACAGRSIGTCLEIGAQTPDASFRTVRYTHVGTEFLREVYDPGAAVWSEPLPVIERLQNTATQKVFTCDTQSTLLRVTIDLHIQPTPGSDPELHLQTSIRPRNFSTVASCP